MTLDYREKTRNSQSLLSKIGESKEKKYVDMSQPIDLKKSRPSLASLSLNLS
jgi:hypothetical protein